MATYAYLRSDLGRYARTLPVRVDKGCFLLAEHIKSDAQSNLFENGSIRTGNLYDSVTVERAGGVWLPGGAGGGGQFSEDSAYIVKAGNRVAFYAHFVEDGTSHSGAKPFMMPAVHANADVSEVRRAIKE